MSSDSENERRNNRATSRELNIVLKELRKVHLAGQDETELRDKLTFLDKEILILKTLLRATATDIIVVWAVFSTFAYSELEAIEENSKALVEHEFRLSAQRSAINRIEEEQE